MDEIKRCPECGTDVEQDGVCPACLMRLGLSGAVPPMPEPEPQPVAKAPAARMPRRPRWRLGWKPTGAAAAATVAVVFLFYLIPGGSEPVRGPVVRFTIAAPEEATIEDFAVSPDGRSLAFTAARFDGRTKLWWHRFDMPASQELAGTEGAAAPFWSPDGRLIGFFADGKLKRIDVGGGPPMTLGDAPLPRGGSWSPRGDILFAGRGPGLMRIAPSGGEVTPVTPTDEGRLQWPFFLPDGVSFLSDGSVPADGAHAGRLDSGEIRKVGVDGAAIYSDGRLIYTRGGTLLSQPFDTNAMELTGEPAPIRYAESVRGGGARPPAFSAAAGVLAYRNGDAPTPRTLMWLERQGRVLGEAGDLAEEGEFSLSPDGSKVAFTRSSQGAADLWVRDLTRGTSTRLTFDGPGVASPTWAPDGKKIAYVASARGKGTIQLALVDGSGAPETLLESPPSVTLNDWSRDGRFLLYTVNDRDDRRALWMLPLQGERKPGVSLQGPFHYKQARLSPDGRWLAYVSDEAGREDVYVQSFPPGTGKWMVSNEGGGYPVWRGDGRELFYIQARRLLMSVAVRAGPALETGAPQTLLEMNGNGPFEVTPDGQRFLISAPMREGRPEPIQVVLNWTAETRP